MFKLVQLKKKMKGYGKLFSKVLIKTGHVVQELAKMKISFGEVLGLFKVMLTHL